MVHHAISSDHDCERQLPSDLTIWLAGSEPHTVKVRNDVKLSTHGDGTSASDGKLGLKVLDDSTLPQYTG